MLHSTRLDENSDLGQALSMPYGGSDRFKVRQLRRSESGDVMVVVHEENADVETVLTERFGGGILELVYLGSSLLVLSTGDYWILLPRP